MITRIKANYTNYYCRSPSIARHETISESLQDNIDSRNDQVSSIRVIRVIQYLLPHIIQHSIQIIRKIK